MRVLENLKYIQILIIYRRVVNRTIQTFLQKQSCENIIKFEIVLN